MQASGKHQRWTGLKGSEIPTLQIQFGKNIFSAEKPRTFFLVLWGIITEPMFILLVASCMLYFVLGEFKEGFIMLSAMIFVSAISFYQEMKSSVALEALKAYTEPQVTVIRDGVETQIASAELVPGDIVVMEEGGRIPADAIIVQANDLTVNESILTGESIPVEKTIEQGSNLLLQGTLLNTGKCFARVTATGNNTALGKLGKIVTSLPTPETLLQHQINAFVKKLALFGFFGFLTICLINYLHNHDWIQSVLLGLTLAMSAIPEEIPVAFSSFMALGAFRLAKSGIITRQPVTIESLGEVTVICLDKTGTLTKNKMEVKSIYDHRTNRVVDAHANTAKQTIDTLTYALLASEHNPFDVMEKAIIAAYDKLTNGELLKEPLLMVNEYPLGGIPPMMTHVYEKADEKIVAAKGALERIIQITKLPAPALENIANYAQSMATQGYRLLGVASAVYDKGKSLPRDQDNFDWQFEGVVALYDPPKDNARAVLQELFSAGIQVKLLTGDFPETAMSMAEQTGFDQPKTILTGEQVMHLADDQLKKKVLETTVFARMFPEAKLKVINALIANGEITAMSGDGVNDGPALKAANIGIAMGKKGSEIARQAASLVLTDDNLEKIVEAIYQGRKIYSNLVKATRYVVSIHIPIIATASMPLLLGWKFANIFTPIHVIFLELIMGPTCSIFFEREPVEANLMTQPPRKRSNLFGKNELMISVIQGLAITTVVLGLQYFFMTNGFSLPYTRSVVFTTLIISNIFLTLVDRSFTETIFETIRYKNNLAYLILPLSILFLCVIHLVTPIRNLFSLETIGRSHFLLTAIAAFVSVMWFEVYKGWINPLRMR